MEHNNIIDIDIPLVSVIIPTFRRAKLIVKAIESVYRQTYKNIEIIIVDDNGNDKYRELTKSRINKYIGQENFIYIQHNSNKGGSIARNTGIKASNADYITFLDDDDYYLPERIEVLMDVLLKSSVYDAVISSMYRENHLGGRINIDENFSRGDNFKDFALDGNIYTGMILIKKDFISKIGGFDVIPRFQDRLFMLKFFKNKGRVKLLKDQLHVMLEHYDDRITYKSSSKGRISHKVVYNIIKIDRDVFSKKEWRLINYKYYYGLASVSAQGRVYDRLLCVLNSSMALFYYYRGSRINLPRLFFRCITTSKFSERIKKYINR